MRSALGYFSLFALVVAGLLLALNFIVPDMLPGREEQGRFIYLLMWLALIGSGAMGSYRANIGVAIKQALAWLVIFLLVVLAYSYRDDVMGLWKKMQGELRPSLPVEVQDATNPSTHSGYVVALRKGDDGHFHANGQVNGKRVKFLVDTGASSVALTAADAKRAGYDLRKLNYNIPVNTASGQIFGAAVMLDSVAVGRIKLKKVPAIVLKDGLDTSLLGMSYLGRLHKFEASRNQLLLRK